MPRLKVLAMLSLATTLWAPAFGQSANPARPGTVNYIEGHASIDGGELSQRNVGKAELNSGQTLATADGKAEILLTPGVFLRLGPDSTVKMVPPDLTRTEVELDRGHAEVEVDQLYRQNDLLVNVASAQGNAQTHVLKNGLYAFDAGAGRMRVFDGKAEVFPTSAAAKPVDVKGGHELVFANGDRPKPQGFNKEEAESQDSLYAWSTLRSQYLGESNARLARQYEGAPGVYPGWAWDPGLYAYTWLPGDGLFWNPFGFGFYSPAYLYGGGFFYGGGYRGFGGGYGLGGYGYRGAAVSHVSAVRAGGGFGGGGFHGGGGRR